MQTMLLLAFLASCCIAVELSNLMLQVSDGGTVNISLSAYNKSIKEDQAFTQLLTINKSAHFVIRVDDIPVEVTFVIIQVHVYMYTMFMSYDKNPVNKAPGSTVTGTNIGLFVDTKDLSETEVYVINENVFAVDSLVAVVAYTFDAPYPGGCNMEFDIEKSPFQKLTYDDAMITVDAQPASVPKIGNLQPPCEKYPLQHDAYRMFMPEQDFTIETYFTAIANMLTVQDIEKNANFIPASSFGSSMRRVYSSYPGTGSVYGMVTYFANRSSAYVPIFTYGCDPTMWFASCSILTTTFSKVLCAMSFFVGLFVAMRGQHYFKTSMFLVGMLIGDYIGYTIGAGIGSFGITGIMRTAMLFGTAVSLIWLLLWLTLSSPIPSLLLSGLTLGSFFFYIFYFTIPVGSVYIEVNAYYWLLYSTFIVLSILIFSVIPLVGNILCFTTVGAYVTILSFDYYGGSNLKYIIINSIRRATIPNFNAAIIQPPYQDKDILLTALWIFLVILGLYKQCASNWNRAPFPPSTPNLVRHNEGAPLLGGRRYRNRFTSISGQRYRTI